MNTIYIDGWDTCKIPPYTPKYDTSTFVNEGAFFDTHPGVTTNVTRYERMDEEGNLVEVWERNDKGVMVDVTEVERLRIEIEAARSALNKIEEVKEDAIP